MAKTTSSKRPGKLAGKKVAFVGKFGWGFLDEAKKFVGAEGGQVVPSEKTAPDFLVAGEGRGGNPPAAVAKIQKKHPGVSVLDEAGFYQVLLPTREEFIAGVTSETAKEYHTRISDLIEKSSAPLDLTGADLRKANLFGLDLQHSNLDDADLRGATLQYTKVPRVQGAKFDGADMANVYLYGAAGCSFREADLSDAWFDDIYGSVQSTLYTDCDFSRARLVKAQGDETRRRAVSSATQT